MNIRQAISDGSVFRHVVPDVSTWWPWLAFLSCLFGLPMDEREAELYRLCTGRRTAPSVPFRAATLIGGRRSGKSFVLALVAVFLAVFRDYRAHLAVGERATIVVIAADRRQARVIFRYIRAIFDAVPALRSLVEGETAEELRLTAPVNIEVMTASSRTIRGYAIPVALLDEACFWSVEGAADADEDIIGALKPAMRQFPDAIMLKASSPYARRGTVWTDYKRHHGQDDAPVLVWQAPTWIMNPTITRESLEAEFEADPAHAAAEFGAEWRRDIEAFVSREVVEAAVVLGRHELPPMSGARYQAFVDPSGGSQDSMTLAIAHREKDGRAVIDAVRERKPPFSPEAVVAEFVELLRSYGVARIVGDRYAGEWPREQFRKLGVSYDLSDRPASDIFRDSLAALNSGKIELLDHPRIVGQLCALERRTSRSGKDAISHPPGGNDDVAVAVCGAALYAAAVRPPMVITDEMLARAAMRPGGLSPINPGAALGGAALANQQMGAMAARRW